MDDLFSFVSAAFLAGLSATIPPGTVFTVTVTESFKRGFRAGFLVILGHAIVEVGVVVMLTMGLGLFLGSEAARATLGLLGGGVLLWMGYETVRGEYRNGMTLPAEPSEVGYSLYAPLTRGFTACVLNPYFIIWWATVGGSFIVGGFLFLGWLAPLVFLACHWASDFPWFTFVSYSVGRGRRFLNERTYRIVVVICGVILSILGLNFLMDGLILVVRRIW